MLKELISDEEAQGMTEYILIIALIAVVCVASIKLFGSQIKSLISKATSKIEQETKGFTD
jgi:Flp pilus assembly pilin Flp